jgi:hypothetical protein
LSLAAGARSGPGVDRAFALAHPHLYRLMTDQPLPRDRLPSGLEERTAAPLLHATGDPQLARAVFAFAHGMVLLELTRRLPADADPQAAWQEGIAAFQTRAAAASTSGAPPRAH